MSKISLTSSSEKQKSQRSNSQNEQNINMGLTYALGPFPDEPLLSIIDKTLLLSSRFRRNSTYTKPLSLSFEIDRPKPSLTKLKNRSTSCPNLEILPCKPILKETINSPSKCSSYSHIGKQSLDTSQTDSVKKCLRSSNLINNILKQCPVSVSNHSLKRTRVDTQNGIKSYEIWCGDVCNDSPSMVFILSPRGDVIPFEYLNKE
ncbi:uncharacterized protein LOC129952492 [Eupeodes corollae]|uniref:uncharacterized protein LOC129952492 n=1 Tax=Eupeodes corollae TaxID=290404 RepID=UPI00249025AD|nr:uncharacterized protein LOC129952492 [Eupeodes corollae]